MQDAFLKMHLKPNTQDFNLLTYTNHLTALVLMKAARMGDTLVNQRKPRQGKDRIFSPKQDLPKDDHMQVIKGSCDHFDMPQRCSLSQYPT